MSRTTKPRRVARRARKITPTSLGEPIIIDGEQVATIWSAGPKASTVWGMLSDGSTRVYRVPTPTRPYFEDLGTGPVWDDIKRASISVGIAGRRLVVRYNSPDWRTKKDFELHEGTCKDIAKSTRETGYSLSGVQLITWAVDEKPASGPFGDPRPRVATLCQCLDEYLAASSRTTRQMAA